MSYTITFSNKKQIKETLEVLQDITDKKANYITKKLKKLLNKSPIKVSSRKQKGRNLQQYICKKLADIFNIKYDQQNDLCNIHSREMGQPGTDIILRGDVFNKFPYAIECKNVEKISINKMIKQAEKHLEGENNLYKNWLIFYKNNKLHYPIVILDIFEFFKIYTKKEN